MDSGQINIKAVSEIVHTDEHKSSLERYSAILNMVLEGVPLGEMLHSLVLLIEAQKIGTRASVLLLSDDGTRLLSGAAPNLPNDYNEAINGVVIGPNVGSCGTAAYLQQRVIVEDIENHPNWADYKSLPLKAGLRACWSEPIFDSMRNVLGTFAMYYDTIKSPTSQDLSLIQEAARLASLAIERSRGLHLQRLSSKIFESLPISLVITNEQKAVLTCNPSFENSTTLYDAKNKYFNIQDYLQPSCPELVKELFNAIRRGYSWQGELKARKTLNDIIDIELVVTVIRDSLTQQNCYAWLITDITARKTTEKLIDFQNHYDQLTGLANRKYLFNKMDSLINESHSLDGEIEPFSMMILDLDHFKQINDTLGSDNGDEVLQTVAKRLLEVLPEHSLPARIAADEFAIVLPGFQSSQKLSEFADKIKAAIGKEMSVANQTVSIGMSSGFATFPSDATTAELMLNCASQAMYNAKSSGRNCHQFFNQDIQLEAERKAQLHFHLKKAINQNELELFYQPIVNPLSGKIIKAEALLRWCHNGQYISPVEFIPIAEQSGLIVEIGEWVKTQAALTAIELKKSGLFIPISVNVSTLEFCSLELQKRFLQFFDRVVDKLNMEEFPYQMITLEITESLMMKQQKEVSELLSLLRHRGIQISIDDFGTGYSSLSYLVSFPVDQIKIDKSFIHQLETDPRHKALVEAIVSMSRALELTVVAEGVETQSQVDFVNQQQIQAVQGYFYYKPMSKSDFFGLL
ncbi:MULTISPECIES: sensor domain-containing phosphodiesterase [Pseudomonadati]|uniref:EAL domain-containing protein n=1 Tax=Shewanella aestuarii TaxID=1028752 RepID=A0ABT0KY48_9GAMM|nr:EAL domain-containing protein [Shewanella aestuarii]MCL1115921.1 EAL domain-containing protein [Shewanella aestuarii]GGN69525.1 bifunctional diguanylate cyclase/phosphodiesterase [Shewanella aestuarii]